MPDCTVIDLVLTWCKRCCPGGKGICQPILSGQGAGGISFPFAS